MLDQKTNTMIEKYIQQEDWDSWNWEEPGETILKDVFIAGCKHGAKILTQQIAKDINAFVSPDNKGLPSIYVHLYGDLGFNVDLDNNDIELEDVEALEKYVAILKRNLSIRLVR